MDFLFLGAKWNIFCCFQPPLNLPGGFLVEEAPPGLPGLPFDPAGMDPNHIKFFLLLLVGDQGTPTHPEESPDLVLYESLGVVGCGFIFPLIEETSSRDHLFILVLIGRESTDRHIDLLGDSWAVGGDNFEVFFSFDFFLQNQKCIVISPALFSVVEGGRLVCGRIVENCGFYPSIFDIFRMGVWNKVDFFCPTCCLVSFLIAIVSIGKDMTVADEEPSSQEWVYIPLEVRDDQTNAIVGVFMNIFLADNISIVRKIQLLNLIGFIIGWSNSNQILISSIIAEGIVVSFFH